MRRPRFDRWIKRECCRIAHADTFSLVKLAALAQSPHSGSSDRISRKRLAAALHLYAMANGCTQRLRSLIYSAPVRERQAQAESHIGARDIQHLALRGTPLLSLPVEYRELLAQFAEAYYAPERIAAEKRSLQSESRAIQLRLGLTCAEIARTAGAAPTNVTTYLTKAATEKLSLKTARAINEDLRERTRKLEDPPSTSSE